MKKRELKELREQSKESLEKRLIELRKKLLDANVKIAVGQETNSRASKSIRRDIAQIRTIINEKNEKGENK